MADGAKEGLRSRSRELAKFDSGGFEETGVWTCWDCGWGNFDTFGDVAGERRAGPITLLVGLKLAFAIRDLSLPLSVALDI